MRNVLSTPLVGAALASLLAAAGCGASFSAVPAQFPNPATASATLRAGSVALGCTPYDSVGGQRESVHLALDCPAHETTVMLMTIQGRLVAACEGLDEDECNALVGQMQSAGATAGSET